MIPHAPRPDAGPATPRAFWRAEDGSLTILGVFMVVLMLAAGGVALDAMRAERQRASLQTTVDRGILAATSLDQERPGDVVMRDYLRAADIPEDAVRIEAFDNGSERRMAVDAVAVTPSLFMDALGVDQLEQPIRASAIEVRTELELSLVLDVSGSMSGNKIANLRTAASAFVGQLLQGREDRTFISLVPYNAGVTFGPTLARHLPMEANHDLSTCVGFEDADYERLGLVEGELVPRKGHFDPDESSNRLGAVPKPECRFHNWIDVLPWSNDVRVLQDRIALMRHTSGTAINVGIKVGTLLLDPSVRPALAGMITDTGIPEALRVDEAFADHPVDYGTTGVHKVVVLMTDGSNTDQHDTRPEHQTGPSTVWVFQKRKGNACDNDGIPDDCPGFSASGPAAATHPFGSTDNPDADHGNHQPHYSLWSDTKKQYWLPHNKTWADAPYGGAEAINISWKDLLATVPTKALTAMAPAEKTTSSTPASQVDAATYRQYSRIAERTHSGASRGDRNMLANCAAARAQGVIIYAIAFQAPSGGQRVMRDCAGVEHPDRYFDVQGLDIETAFDDILASVSRLRLTR